MIITISVCHIYHMTNQQGFGSLVFLPNSPKYFLPKN